MPPLTNPTAFVSWAHRDDDWDDERAEAWRDEVSDFVAALRRYGIKADVDLHHGAVAGIDWNRFGPKAVTDNEWVIAGLSLAWRERWEGRNAPDAGAGAVAECDALMSVFSRDQVALRRKLVLVTLPSMAGLDVVPDGLHGFHRFELDGTGSADLEDLLRLLTGQPRNPAEPLGNVPDLPPVVRPPSLARVALPSGGIEADIDHLDGCPMRPDRIETYTQQRERDGVSVDIAHCLDCGAMAYRHGDRPDASSPAADARRVLARRAAEVAAGLQALCARWNGQINAFDGLSGLVMSVRERRERSSNAIDLMLAEYYADHSVDVAEVFDLLAAYGTVDPERRAEVESPPHPGTVEETATLLREAARQMRAAPVPARVPMSSPAGRLRRALREAMDLRAGLAGAPTDEWDGPIKDDPVYGWARRTWELLREHPFTEYADDFVGNDLAVLGPAHFMTAYVSEIRDPHKSGRAGYVDDRIEWLKRLLRSMTGESARTASTDLTGPSGGRP